MRRDGDSDTGKTDPPVFPGAEARVHDFDEYPREIVIENELNCDVEHLVPCDTRDPFSTSRCKEMSARCVHFDKDVRRKNDDGEIVTIPANKSVNEGYALPITIQTACNAYHGDPILVSRNVSETEYMIVCLCKVPDAFGNETITGDCTTPFMCRGRFEQSNPEELELENISCRCSPTQSSIRNETTKISTCREMSVVEANEKYPNGWSHLLSWSPTLVNRLAPIERFEKRIAQNVNIDRLIDPCKASFDEPLLYAIPNGEYADTTKSCRTTDYGIPVKIDVLSEAYGSQTFDGAKFYKYDGILRSGPYESLRVSDSVRSESGYTRITAPIYYDFEKDRPTTNTYAESVHLATPQGIVGIGRWYGNLFMTMRDEILGANCVSEVTTNTCPVQNKYRKRNSETDLPRQAYNPPDYAVVHVDAWNKAENLASYEEERDDRNARFLRVWSRFTQSYGERLRVYGVAFYGMSAPRSKKNGLLFMRDGYEKQYRTFADYLK